jgi:hypothetical protein
MTMNLEPEGFGAFRNPWRQLTPGEVASLYEYAACNAALTAAVNAGGQLINGAYVNHFSCSGYSFMLQRQPALRQTYWYVYNHPGPIVFEQKRPEVVQTTTQPYRGGIPVWGSQMSTLPSYGPGLLGVPSLMTQMHSGYRHHRRIGALPDDLTAFDGTISAADFYLANSEWQNAVMAYQAAGNTGATTIGPEIDASTGGSSQPLTQQAWAINGNLAAVNSTSSASQSDAISAQGFARQMQNIYHSILNNIAQGGGGGGTGPVQPSQALVAASNALVSYLQTNGCSQSSISQVVAFQTQYNAEGSQQLPTDGKYGALTQGALQRVMTASGGGTAPQNCFQSGGGSGGGGGGGTPPTTVTPIQAGVFPWGTAALITSAVVAAGYIAYESKHGKHLMRHAGHHARRLHHGLKHRLLRRRHA